MAIKNIKLSCLFVNTENYRFEALDSQKEAIDKMIENQSDKLYNLATDIMENGLSPVDIIQVTPGKMNNSYIVLEGNRRITSLKILNNPSLISDSYPSLRNKFLKLQKTYSSNLINAVDCVVFENPQDADIWIKRKHSGELNGVGTVTWDSQQKQRFEEKVEGKSSIPLQIISLLKEHANVPNEIKENLSNLSTTNLQRLISDPFVREKLGIEINEGKLVSKIDTNEVLKGLVRVVKDILSPTFKVAEIYDRDKRKEYISKLPINEIPDLMKESDSLWELQNYNSSEKDTIKPLEKKYENKSILSIPTTRKTLIPKKFNLKIENPKINKIFNELKTLPILSCSNASAILYRVFLELSLDLYLEKCQLIKNEAITASASKESLQGKANKIINHLYQKGVINSDISKGIKSEMNDPTSVLSLDSLNAYVHNTIFYPKSDNLIVGWDNVEKFIEILWNNINTNE